MNYQVSEAIQVGVQAIKECNINVEEVLDQLQELDEHIKAQKEVAEVLGNASYLFNRTKQEGFIVITIPGHLGLSFCWGNISQFWPKAFTQIVQKMLIWVECINFI